MRTKVHSLTLLLLRLPRTHSMVHSAIIKSQTIEVKTILFKVFHRFVLRVSLYNDCTCLRSHSTRYIMFRQLGLILIQRFIWDLLTTAREKKMRSIIRPFVGNVCGSLLSSANSSLEFQRYGSVR